MTISRKNALKKLGALAGTLFLPGLGKKENSRTASSAMVKQSVSRWPYTNIPLDIFCKQVKQIGITSVELVGPDEWTVLKNQGLQCAMANGAEIGLTEGFCDPENHPKLIENYRTFIPKVSEAGIANLICFSGNRNGISDRVGLENSAKALKKLMPVAKRHGVVLCMELLNSKVDHPDYMCDRTSWGVELCQKVGSDHFKLLYDIYHMQIMEGDIIRTIRDYGDYFAHYHTGGVPGRKLIDKSQELNYPAIIKAIYNTGYEGFVGHEFIPREGKKIAELKKAYEICNI